MTDAAARIAVSRIVNPESIAVIGASENIDKFGGRILHNLVRHGYRGRVLPINPNRESLLGFKAYACVAAAPGPIDLALVAVPAEALRDTIEDCARAGVGACIVITAKLAEFDSAGARLQDEIVAVARAHGMRLVGPNCMGMINPPHGLALSSTMTLNHVERLRPGGVGLASQSGALMSTLFIHGEDHGVGFSRLISVGNQADLELCDFLEYLIDDPATSTICLYIESVKSPRRFLDLAQRAARSRKPVLAVKAGRTDAGTAAARSHTASLAGSYAAFEAACRSTGIVAMDEPEGMVLVAGILDKLGPIGPGGVGLVVSSGGGGAVTADRMVEAGLPLANWSDATRARLGRHFLPAHINNPMDVGSHFGPLVPQLIADLVMDVAEDANVAVMMYIMTPQPLMAETADAVVAAWRKTGKPCVMVFDSGSFARDVRARLLDAGLPLVSRIDDGLRALDVLFRQRALRAWRDLPPAVRPASAGPTRHALPSGRLTESEAKALVRAYGIPVAREQLARTMEEAIDAAGRIGYPVVMKGVNRDVVHKSDLGLVKLNLPAEHAVRAAFADIAAALKRVAPNERALVVVQEWSRGEAELILGARYDDDFGPLVMVGFGGVLVELLKDVSLACAPVSAEQARCLLRELKLRQMFDGVRGRHAIDVAAIADAMVRISWLACDLGERLRELDVNPLLARAEGRGVIAVDARATISPEAAPS